MGHQVQRVDLRHEDPGRDLVELDEPQEGVEDLQQRLLAAPGELLAPHQRRLELVELLGPELLPGEDEADHVVRELGEGPGVEHRVAVAVDEDEDLLDEEVGGLVLDVLVGRAEEGADGVDSQTALSYPVQLPPLVISSYLYEAETHLLQLLQLVILRTIQNSLRSPVQ